METTKEESIDQIEREIADLTRYAQKICAKREKQNAGFEDRIRRCEQRDMDVIKKEESLGKLHASMDRLIDLQSDELAPVYGRLEYLNSKLQSLKSQNTL